MRVGFFSFMIAKWCRSVIYVTINVKSNFWYFQVSTYKITFFSHFFKFLYADRFIHTLKKRKERNKMLYIYNMYYIYKCTIEAKKSNIAESEFTVIYRFEIVRMYCADDWHKASNDANRKFGKPSRKLHSDMLDRPIMILLLLKITGSEAWSADR